MSNIYVEVAKFPFTALYAQRFICNTVAFIAQVEWDIAIVILNFYEFFLYFGLLLTSQL